MSQRYCEVDESRMPSQPYTYKHKHNANPKVCSTDWLYNANVIIYDTKYLIISTTWKDLGTI